MRRLLQLAALWVAATGMGWGGERHLTIALYNYADLGPEVLDSAMKIVTETLAVAGLEPVWSLCMVAPEQWVEGCTRRLPPGGRYVTVNLMWTRKSPVLSGGLGYEVAGMAIQDSARLYGARAFAFCDAVKTIAGKAHRETAMVLACVMVHEIAHTLGLRHRERGVMRAVLDPRGMDEAVQGLAFDEGQVTQLRRAVMRLNVAEK